MNKFLIGGAAAAALLAGGAAIAASPTTAVKPHAASPRHAAKMARTETRTDVQAHVVKLFARLDVNKDGAIAKDDLGAIEARRTAKLEKRAKRFDGAKMFARLDANHDGKITSAEADAAHSQRAAAKGGKPVTAQATAASGLFARADGNKDKIITRAEFDSLAGRVHARLEKAVAGHEVGGRMIEMSDSNKDGRVSVAELQQVALARFDRIDANRDGKITPAERKQARAALKAERKPG